MELIHQPDRESDVAAWIKRHRDKYNEHESYDRYYWNALNDLLDDYRLHADYEIELGKDVDEGSQ